MDLHKIERYAITDGEIWVENNTASKLTTDREEANTWSSETSAQNVLKDAMNRSNNSKLSNSFKVVQYNIYESDLDPVDIETIKTLQNFVDIIFESKETASNLAEELRRVDRELSDLEHFIEFTDLDIRRGFKAYKKLQTLRQTRRELKRRLKLAKEINSQNIDPNVIKSVISYLKNVNYRPRELDFNDILEDT